MFAQYKAKVNSVCHSQQAEATAALTAQLEEVTTAATADAALLQQHLLEATESGALATQQLAKATQHADANKAKTTALREQLAELLLAKADICARGLTRRKLLYTKKETLSRRKKRSS